MLAIVLSSTLINHPTSSPLTVATVDGPNSHLNPLQENTTLGVIINSSVYIPTDYMQVQANFTFENGTAIDGAVVGFILEGPNQEPLQSKANTTDGNGISTQSFLLSANYYTGNYTMHVTASKGAENNSQTIIFYVNASYIQISMLEWYLIGDLITVHASFKYWNGTSIDNAMCGFIIRNESGPLQSKANFTDYNGISTQSF